MKLSILLMLILFSSGLLATTWGESEVDDPILEGEKCSIHEPASYGGYIYSWPSKYDQVFWPLTDEHGIWFCAKSGFTAFIGDFSDLTPEETGTIRIYLAKHSSKSNDIEMKLELLENIYALRDTDEVFKNKLLRVLARWNQDLGNIDKANTYREAAFQEIEVSLKEALSEFQQLEYLYLAANYSRQFGEVEKSNRYLSELQSLMKTTQNEEEKGFSEYLKKLISDTKLIKKGGKLDPELPQ